MRSSFGFLVLDLGWFIGVAVVSDTLTPQDEQIYREAYARIHRKLVPDSLGNHQQNALRDVRQNPIAGAVVELYRLTLKRVCPRYLNDNSEHLAFINSQLTRRFALKEIISRFAFAPVLGNGVAEFTPKQLEDGRWGVGRLTNMLPGRYRFVRDRETHELTGVNASGNLIPIEKVLHVIEGDHLAFDDPEGVGSHERMDSLLYAWRLLMNEMLLAGRRQATGILVGKTQKADVNVLDAQGRPITRGGEPVKQSSVWLLADKMRQLKANGDVLAGDENTDFKMLAQDGGEDFWEMSIRLILSLVFVAMLSPETIFLTGRGGLGSSGLAQQHAMTLLILMESIAEEISAEVHQKIIVPLIFWNYGPQEDYGYMSPLTPEDPDRIELLKILAQYAQEAFSDADLNQKVAELIGF